MTTTGIDGTVSARGASDALDNDNSIFQERHMSQSYTSAVSVPIKTLGVVLAALTLTAVTSGCVPLVLGGAAAVVTVAEDRRSAGMFVDDEGMENQALLRVKSRFGGQVHVNITSYNRQVLVTGEAVTEDVKRGVEEEISTIKGIKRVFNEMSVGSLAGVMGVSNDTRLTAVVKTRFLDASRFQANHVKVVTEAGVVYLLGIVKKSEAEAATQLASTTRGVARVVRLFEYLD